MKSAASANDYLNAFIDIPEVGGTDRRETPQWLAERLVQHNRVVRQGDGWKCKHLTTPETTYVMAAWKPGTKVCVGCAAAVFRQEGDDENTCDGCGLVFPQGLRPMVMALDDGKGIMHAGSCLGCLGPIVAA